MTTLHTCIPGMPYRVTILIACSAYMHELEAGPELHVKGR